MKQSLNFKGEKFVEKENVKKKIIIVIPTVCLLVLGCKAVQEDFLKEYVTVSKEIVRIVDANPTAEGVKQAQNYLDSKKTLLKSKFVANDRKSSGKDTEDKFRVIVLGF